MLQLLELPLADAVLVVCLLTVLLRRCAGHQV